jgi:DNA-binding transcriptional LysR family regulator
MRGAGHQVRLLVALFESQSKTIVASFFLFFQSMLSILYILNMNVTTLDLNLLVALDALLQEEGVSRGGRKIGLSQPAMSHALGKLRGLLDDPLLVRTGGGMQLTLRAQSMRHAVRDALERVHEVFVSDTFVPASSARTFRIFMSDYSSNLLLSPLLKAVQRRAPGVRIEVHPWRGIAADSVEDGRPPDAVVACQTHDLPGYYRQRLFTDHDVCVMRAGHPLQRRGFCLKTFLEARHVAVVAVEFSEDPVDAWLKEAGHPRCVVVTVPHYMEALHLVAATELLAVIPERLARAYTSTLNLVTKAVPLDVGTFDEFLLHSARTHADLGCSWLRRMIQSQCAGIDGKAHRPEARVGAETARLRPGHRASR